MKFDKQDLLLYAVTDRSWLGQTTLYEQVKAVLLGGATFVQLRDKDLDKASLYEEAIELKKLCEAFQVPFVINDFVDLALRLDADGVHVGQKDMEAKEVRTRIGPNKILGVSVQTVEQAIKAEEAGADYLGVGAVFPTETKPEAADVNQDTLISICQAVHIPVVAIGGITAERVPKLKNSKIAGVAVVSALFAQKDILSATKALKKGCKEVFYP